MTSMRFVIFDFSRLYEKQTSLFFRQKFSSTKTPKFSEILRLMSNFPVDTRRKLNVLCMFNLRPVSTG